MNYLNWVFVITLFFVVLAGVSSQNETITWCVLSDAEEQKCLDFAVHSSGKNFHGKLQCTRAYNSIDCMEKIKNGTADAATMAGDDIYAAAVGDFFGYSCVPGVKDPEYDPKGNNPKNLCEACIGDDNDGNICANDPSERHFGEVGALRCVAENLGDVAFVKHSTVFDTMNVKDPESWVKDLELEDLKLLCPDGTEATLTEHRKCNLAAVPASAVVVRLEDKCRVFKFLNRAQRMFGNAMQGFSLFDSSPYGGKDLMFTDGTRKLLKVVGSYSSWLGPSYTKVLQAFECEGKFILNVKVSAKSILNRNCSSLCPNPSFPTGSLWM
ncbi:Otolith matrix protein 1 [Acipenser ruthenus]|uniref:Otolith matrix protein 1 n=1 Tax=Acipenser ruthenus TaxID=7906 RepID=A0A662YU66_ACIRT|nr:Otolith matrix protein 1 [Acipenser ruthenus]